MMTPFPPATARVNCALGPKLRIGISWGGGEKGGGGKLQALVYDILPSTTGVFSYAIGPRKLSANERGLFDAQTVVSLSKTTQIISDVCFITDHAAYASSNQTKSV